MVPREAGRGRSFKGAGQYYLHDKKALTSERVAFTHTENIPTQDPEKALKWMAWTAIHAEELKRDAGVQATGRAASKPVFTFSLSWHPEEEPTKRQMIGAGRRALIALGLQDHETLMVAHSDRPHKHLHVIVSTIHPETGRSSRVSYSRKKLSVWAQEYEQEHGKIYCRKRVENNALRAEEKAKHENQEIDLKATITKLYLASDSGEAFRAALAEQGFKLAQGKRIVVIDADGNVHSLSRQIEGVKTRDIRAKLWSLELPNVDETVGQSANSETTTKPQSNTKPKRKRGLQDERAEPVYADRDEQDREWQELIIDASINADKNPAAQTAPPSELCGPSPYVLNRLQDKRLAELGRFGTESTQARLKLTNHLDQQYGGHERQARASIGRLEGILGSSGRVRLWWLKLTGQVPNDPQQELENMRMTLANVEGRQREARDALEARIRAQRQAMEARHLEELQNPPKFEDATNKWGAQYDEPLDNPGEEQDLGPSLGY